MPSTAMPGHENVVDDDRMAARAGKPRDVPIVLVLDIADRQQEKPRILRRQSVDLAVDRDLVAVVVDHQRAKRDPGAVVGARGERPEPAQHVAVLHLAGLAARLQHRGDMEVGLDRQRLALRLLREMRDDPAMLLPDRKTPCRRGTAAGDLLHDLQARAEIVLGAAVAFRDPDLAEVGGFEVAHRLVRQAA
jgi:predicted ABC-type transport system involved in lysophospholipase L1 biosynthesis ATPase subunit